MASSDDKFSTSGIVGGKTLDGTDITVPTPTYHIDLSDNTFSSSSSSSSSATASCPDLDEVVEYEMAIVTFGRFEMLLKFTGSWLADIYLKYKSLPHVAPLEFTMWQFTDIANKVNAVDRLLHDDTVIKEEILLGRNLYIGVEKLGGNKSHINLMTKQQFDGIKYIEKLYCLSVQEWKDFNSFRVQWTEIHERLQNVVHCYDLSNSYSDHLNQEGFRNCNYCCYFQD